MNRLFVGKFGADKPEQITEKFYAAGPKGDSWYGGIEAGDLVYPIFEGKVIGLWRVKGYTQKNNRINKNDSGVVEFDEVSSFNNPIPIAQFIRNQAFSLNINLLNKAVKSSRGCGFFEITLEGNHSVESLEVDFNQKQNFYIALQDQPLPNDERQIVVVIDNLQNTRILSIIRRKGDSAELYEPLMELYENRNLPTEKYTLKELLRYANNEAPNKAKYISTVLQELDKQGWYAVSNPVQLYDNILVGRRRTPKSKNNSTANSTNVGSYIQDADDEDTIEISESYKRYAELLEFNPNLVLYGPPGTGKTYATKKIIEAFENKNSNLIIPFEQVEREGRVKFVTFHQSYSYEEFIEGIRPRFNTDEAVDSGGSLQYGIENGILKEMATAAFTQTLKSELKSDLLANTKESSRIWKVSLGKRSDDQTYDRCKQNNWIAVGWLSNHNLTGKNYEDIYNILKSQREPDAQAPGNDASTLDSIVNEMNTGDIVLIYDSPTTIRDVGVIRSGYKYMQNESFPHIRHVAWLKEFEQPYDIYDANGRTRLTLKTIYELTRFNMSDIQQMIQADHEAEAAAAQQADEPKPYYLIIDEINRGNISKIFGELITLIEKDKRQSLSVTLPYSQKPFTLPRNLYLIGTMNTADRSITALDTALRRRFAFVEVEPDYSVFTNPNLNLSAMVNDVIDLEKLLRTLNERVLKHLDRDHRIGQAYFMDVLSISDLYHTWYYKILPLLSEYFYNDPEAVKRIVGNRFYDQYGSMVFLNQHKEGQALSEFERALIDIYKGKASDE
ncbi:AAA family ATPase [Paenibacillus sp. JX-17]|uniref:AAA family ATPase n=1 Tax=Paenibacillus lacisoli TaxID=3064525 RepID=A0ABT9CE80_9BACL|nr:AAA family ATPase [Paenibacillus sp. JX-17]MDO7907580.1 AAA family ATPase [Paenibacillus sp. JX-17]